MKISEQNLEGKAKEAILSCLSRVPFLKIGKIKKEVSKEGARPDLLVKLEYPNEKET